MSNANLLSNDIFKSANGDFDEDVDVDGGGQSVVNVQQGVAQGARKRAHQAPAESER